MPAGRVRPKHFPEVTLLSFVALAINILTTVFGVALPESLTARQVVYGLLLVSCFFTFAFYLLLKHAFLASTRNVKPWCVKRYPAKGRKDCCLRSCFCSWSMVHDVTLCAMALLYLLGDNLEMACQQRYCPIVARFSTGLSLSFNIVLKLLKTSGTKPKLPKAFPVIGMMGDVYDKMLQIAAEALTVDQTVTTVVESITGTSNSTVGQGYILVVDNTRGAQRHAIVIMVLACAVVAAIVMDVLVFLCRANRKVCCNSENEKVNWCERVLQWGFGVLVTIFLILFIWSDIDWFWTFFE